MLSAPDDDWVPSLNDTPFTRLGGVSAVQALVERFYDTMEAEAPALARLHRMTPQGRISPESRQRFALFLVGWLGGPQDYTAQHGHPRLRMRHQSLAVDQGARDAWLRCMQRALDLQSVGGGLRRFLDARFSQVADFLRNTPG